MFAGGRNEGSKLKLYSSFSALSIYWSSSRVGDFGMYFCEGVLNIDDASCEQ